MSAPDFAMLVIVALSSVAAGLAYAVLARRNPGFFEAKILAWMAAIGFGSLGIIWGSTNMTYALGWRVLAAALLAAVVGGALTWVIADINGQAKENGASKNGGVKIVLGTEKPFSTLAQAGANRRRTTRIKIENNTATEISGGKLQALNLDPPYRDQTDFLIKGDISIPPHGHIFVDVAYYDEGTSAIAPSKWMYFVIPPGYSFAEAIPTLPIDLPHTFHLKFSTLEGGLFDEVYCRLSVGLDQILHLEDGINSARKSIAQAPKAQIRFENWDPIVAADFKAIGERRQELGNPRLNGARKIGAYQAAHEHAAVIWIEHYLYKLPLDGMRKVEWESDPDFNLDPRMASDDYVRTLIKIPKGKRPPHFGVAEHWKRDAKKWEWIGGLLFDCAFAGSAFYYQEFEKGFIVGVFRKSESKSTQGQIFVIFNDGTWRIEDTKALAPECSVPGDR